MSFPIATAITPPFASSPQSSITLVNCSRGRCAAWPTRPNCWLDLETFLRDLWRATQEASIDFYWGSFAWDPEFEMARKKEQYPAGEDRMLAYWLACEAVWAANAIMVTLATLGLVERGQTDRQEHPPVFSPDRIGTRGVWRTGGRGRSKAGRCAFSYRAAKSGSGGVSGIGRCTGKFAH